MDSQPTNRRDNEAPAFQRILEQFLLNAYTDGHTVEGEWNVTVPITDAPNWMVTVTKSYSEEDSSYQPAILEE